MNYFIYVLIGGIGLYVVYIYNKLIFLKQNVIEAWSGIDVQLKRRYDLIPNLVALVEKYVDHEKNTLKLIVELRNQAMGLDNSHLQEKYILEKQIHEQLQSIFILSESYPELKANTMFLKLQEELVETEDQIASSRRIYNSNTADYNTYVNTFPSNIIASIMNFHSVQFFQA
ncbi:MAG: LemA family protein, partial [bacterium]|nr:LemA family protein [bacterium]